MRDQVDLESAADVSVAIGEASLPRLVVTLPAAFDDMLTAAALVSRGPRQLSRTISLTTPGRRCAPPLERRGAFRISRRESRDSLASTLRANLPEREDPNACLSGDACSCRSRRPREHPLGDLGDARDRRPPTDAELDALGRSRGSSLALISPITLRTTSSPAHALARAGGVCAPCGGHDVYALLQAVCDGSRRPRSKGGDQWPEGRDGPLIRCGHRMGARWPGAETRRDDRDAEPFYVEFDVAGCSCCRLRGGGAAWGGRGPPRSSFTATDRRGARHCCSFPSRTASADRAHRVATLANRAPDPTPPAGPLRLFAISEGGRAQAPAGCGFATRHPRLAHGPSHRRAFAPRVRRSSAGFASRSSSST